MTTILNKLIILNAWGLNECDKVTGQKTSSVRAINKDLKGELKKAYKVKNNDSC